MLNGNLEGQVHVRESAELQAGRLVGELYAGSLQVAKGVILDGVVHMLNTSPSEPAIQHSASETLTASDY